jgi:hypothetical protein
VGSSVTTLDKSGWDKAALSRLDRVARWEEAAQARRAWDASPAGVAYAEALAAHPLAGALEGVTEESMELTRNSGGWLFKSWDPGNGLTEAFAMRRQVYPQAQLDRAIRRDLAHLAPPRGLGDREKSVANAAQRAKQEVRRLCKTMRVNSLWTLTYKANVQDRDTVLKHLDAFRRRVVSVLGEWRYVATLEKQERGAYHIHLATHALPQRIVQGEKKNRVKVKSWDVMRAIWRSVTGELGGNFDEAKRRGKWGTAKPMKSAAQIASYIAGYVAKDMLDGELNRKRYSASKGIDVPPCYSCVFATEDATMLSLIELAYSAVPGTTSRTWYDKERQCFYVESDASPG